MLNSKSWAGMLGEDEQRDAVRLAEAARAEKALAESLAAIRSEINARARRNREREQAAYQAGLIAACVTDDGRPQAGGSEAPWTE